MLVDIQAIRYHPLCNMDFGGLTDDQHAHPGLIFCWSAYRDHLRKRAFKVRDRFADHRRIGCLGGDGGEADMNEFVLVGWQRSSGCIHGFDRVFGDYVHREDPGLFNVVQCVFAAASGHWSDHERRWVHGDRVEERKGRQIVDPCLGDGANPTDRPRDNQPGTELVGTDSVKVGYVECSFGVEIGGGHGRSIVGVKPRGQTRARVPDESGCER